jgi:hypothetical protein
LAGQVCLIYPVINEVYVLQELNSLNIRAGRGHALHKIILLGDPGLKNQNFGDQEYRLQIFEKQHAIIYIRIPIYRLL